eukprot:3241310-Rhodomonas_salina.2
MHRELVLLAAYTIPPRPPSESGQPASRAEAECSQLNLSVRERATQRERGIWQAYPIQSLLCSYARTGKIRRSIGAYRFVLPARCC